MNNKQELRLNLLQKIKYEESDTINYVIPDFLSKKLRDYTSILNDLSHVISATNLLIKFREEGNNVNPTLQASLWYSLIILYGKCFTDASSSSRTKLEINSCLSSSDGVFHNIHKKLMDLRHNYLAHRGANSYEMSVAFLKIPKNRKPSKDQLSIRVKSQYAFKTSKKELQDYLDLFSKIKNYVEQKKNIQGNKTYKGFLKIILDIPLLSRYLLIK